MTKRVSGIVFLLVGIGLNLIGRVILALAGVNRVGVTSDNLHLVGFVALMMMASLVVGIVGLYRLGESFFDRPRRVDSLAQASGKEPLSQDAKVD
jgi:hypothetical protein